MGNERLPRNGEEQTETAVPSSAMRVGRADDPAEARADRFAELVMAGMRAPAPLPAAEQVAGVPARVRRSTRPVAPSAGSARRSASAPTHDPLGGTAVDGRTARSIRATSGGRALPETVRRAAEEQSGRDLSGVRVHRSAKAADLSAGLQATAFTVGSNIFLGGGAESPGTSAGDHLLAHELGHVVEEGGGTTAGRVRRRTDLRPLDQTGEAPTVRRLFGSGKKKRQKADAKQAALQQQADAAAAAEAAKHPAYPALLSAVMTVEQQLKWLRDGKASVVEDAPTLVAYATTTARGLPGTEKDPGFGPLKRRLRIAADEAQILLDESAVADTKRRAGEIYIKEGASGGLTALTNQMRTQEFDGTQADDKALARQKLGAALGLSRAEQAAITTFTAQDYKYMNPAAANSSSWMLANRDRDLTEGMSAAEKAQTLAANTPAGDQAYTKPRLQEGSLHTGMALQGLLKLPVYDDMTYRGEAFNRADFLKRFKLDKKGRATARTKTSTRATISSASKLKDKAEAFVFTSSADLQLPNKLNDSYCLIWEYKLIDGRDIEKLSANEHEAEVATLPGATFEIVDVTPFDTAGSYFLRGYQHVYRVRARQVK